MNCWIYDKNFSKLQLMDGVYESFIWTPRYNEPGDFELNIPIQSKYQKNLQIGNYLEMVNDDANQTTMIIETRQIETKEDGTHIKITGRSYDSILDRRFVWNKKTYAYNASTPIFIYNIINDILSENVTYNGNTQGIDDADKVKRKMPVEFDTSALTEKVKSYKIYEDLEFYNDSVLDVIQTLCQDKRVNLGFKMVRNKTNNRFKFILYKGKDLTKNNTEGNKYVMFSNRLGNLPSSSYIQSDKPLKNMARVESNSIVTYYPPTNNLRQESGIDRREIAISPSLSNSEQASVTPTMLQTKAKRELMEYQMDKVFEGEVIEGMFKCNVDYHIGDVVEFENEFGDKDKARIKEIVFSSELDGDKIYPTLESTSKERENI